MTLPFATPKASSNASSSASPHAAATPAFNATPLLGEGLVRHTRLRPQHHAFAYGTFFVLLPMRSLAAGAPSDLPINRAGWLSFHDRDHGDGRTPEQGGALQWLDELLQREGIHDANGEVWLHCYPRVLGYTFKPVSFWYCHGSDNQLRAIVVEVNNTFGERHCYLLDRPQWGVEQTATKVFHVSPFCAIEGQYRFRFMRTFDRDINRTVARIDHDDATGPLIQTSVCGELLPATRAALRHVLWRYPLLTLMVIVRIHWQALHLWRKRIAFFTKPTPPSDFVTR